MYSQRCGRLFIFNEPFICPETLKSPGISRRIPHASLCHGHSDCCRDGLAAWLLLVFGADAWHDTGASAAADYKMSYLTLNAQAFIADTVHLREGRDLFGAAHFGATPTSVPANLTGLRSFFFFFLGHPI